jgi:hypothetical protein
MSISDNSIKQKRYYRKNNYNIDFKLYEYKLEDTKTISEEIADECTNIEKEGGEVLNIIYNTYPLLNTKINNILLGTNKKNVEIENVYNKKESNDYNEDKKKEEHSLLEYIKRRSPVHLKSFINQNKLKKNTLKKNTLKKNNIIKEENNNIVQSCVSYLKNGIIDTFIKYETTVVYIIYSSNAILIKIPRKFYVYVEKANSLNSNITIGNIAVGQFNKLLIKNYTHICTLIDSYSSMKDFGSSYKNETVNIITFYAK